MKNADLPAMPVVIPNNVTVQPCSGLTKREMIATHAMQGLLAAPDLNTTAPRAVAASAVAYADALLAELGRTQQP